MKKAIVIIILAVIVSLPSLSVFFSGDDFFHLKISQVSQWQDSLAFFSFEKNSHSGSFYRPLTTQVFFFLGQRFFGLNPVGYHFMALVFFAILLWLTFRVTKMLTQDEKIAVLSLFFSAFSVAHFTPVFYLSAFQELGLAVFYLAGVMSWLTYLKNRQLKPAALTIFFFLLALLAKETAVTLPLILILVAIFLRQKLPRFLLAILLVVDALYLYGRLVLFGGVTGESYLWAFSPRVFNTLFWYGAWSLGLPEMFLDFVGPGLKLSQKLWLYYRQETQIIFTSFISLFVLIIVSILMKLKERETIRIIIFGAIWFLITLLPVLFLPWHKFPLELTLPLLGITLVLGSLFNKSHRYLLLAGLAIFLILNMTSYLLTLRTHWVVRRAEVASKVVNYFQKNYPVFPPNQSVYFQNDSAFITAGWGASKHIDIALSGSDALQVMYRNPEIKVFYEDKSPNAEKSNQILLGTKMFLGY